MGGRASSTGCRLFMPMMTSNRRMPIMKMVFSKSFAFIKCDEARKTNPETQRDSACAGPVEKDLHGRSVLQDAGPSASTAVADHRMVHRPRLACREMP